MFKLNEIKELIELLDQTSLQEIEIESEGTKLALRKPKPADTVMVASTTSVQPAVHALAQPHPAHAAAIPTIPAPALGSPAPVATGGSDNAAPAVDPSLVPIKSPMVGTFYSAPSPGASNFVSRGTQVKERTVVCIVEAMKLMNEIEAEIKGEIVEVLVENGTLVEYGQPLFLVKPE